MIIGVYKPQKLPFSFRIIIQNVTEYLTLEGVEFIFFENITEIPQKVDLYWDPNVGGGYLPTLNKNNCSQPIVITFHGARLFALKISELKTNKLGPIKILKHRFYLKRKWKEFVNHYAKVITVSNYSKSEILKYTTFKEEQIIPIHLAVDFKTFFPHKNKNSVENKYFLHVSEYQPVKNLDRIIKAYLMAVKNNPDFPDFYIMSRNFNEKIKNKKIKILDSKPKTNEEIAKLYRNAFALLFPTLHEGFGIPILEAMASGIPVITSNTTACEEVANNSALLVDPKNINEIANEIKNISENTDLYKNMQKKGFERVKDFSWKKTANQHYNVFKNCLK